MNSFEQFFSSNSFLSVADAFGGRQDLFWTLAASDLLLGICLLSITVIGVFLCRRIRIRIAGLILVVASLIVFMGLTHLVSVWLIFEPVYWLSATLKAVTAVTALVVAIWTFQAWPEMISFGILARKFEAYHNRTERRHNRVLFSNAGFQQLLNRSVFLPIALSLLLIVVFTSQIIYLVRVKSEVAEATRSISYMHAVQRLFVDAESGLRGYLLTGQSEYLQPFEYARSKTPTMLNDLLERTKSDPLVNNALYQLAENFTAWMKVANPMIENRTQGKPYRNSALDKNLRLSMDRSRAQFAEAIRLTVTQRDQHSDNADQATHLFIIISVSLSGLIGIALALWSRRQILTLARNYSKALETSRELNFHLEQRVVERTKDLEEANRALAQANSELEAFSYSVSHDLRGPLRGIDGFSQILVEDELERLRPESRKHLDFIREGVRKMGQLIDDLLNLSRISKAELAVTSVNASTVAREVAENLRALNPHRSSRIDIEPNIPMMADPNLLHVVLQNLIGNAWKFSGAKDSVDIRIKAIQEPGLSGFEISDRGAGFDMTFKDKLFQPFQRLHSAQEFEGTGVGLALCCRVVLRHGGSITAEGIPGEGAEFRVLFPVLAESSPRLPSADAPTKT